MQVTVLGMRSEILPVDFEAPSGVQSRCVSSLRVQRHPTSTAIAMQLFPRGRDPRVTAVWDLATGKLAWKTTDVSDIAWSPDGTQAFVVMSKFGTGPKDRGIGHRLLRFSWPGLASRKGPELLEQFVFSVPSGGADYLVVSPAGNLGLVVSLEQGDWYYEVLRLQPCLSQPLIGHYVPHWLGDCPAFSPDERFVVTVACSRGPKSPEKWWAPEVFDWEEKEEPVSPGGTFIPGFVYVHDLAKKRVTEHSLKVKLPAGWQPQKRKDDPGGDGWNYVWGPKFRDARSFRLWMPDGSPLDLTLPLPKVIDGPAIQPIWKDQGAKRKTRPGKDKTARKGKRTRKPGKSKEPRSSR